MKTNVLFLCTGNYYRSRFAELLFNHLAAQRGAPWTADSRGLAIELGVNNVGAISPHTVARLAALGVPLPATMRFPQQVTDTDVQAATLTIALDRAEHYPLMRERLPGWTDRIEYWNVADLHALTAAEALAQIEAAVKELLHSLA
ncbi:MAG: low molecular weight phosphatase family protein [Caldilineaceae bacterium]|nr:low molecular weight phosphatase family protein [Caldilineaceae bacterium]